MYIDHHRYGLKDTWGKDGKEFYVNIKNAIKRKEFYWIVLFYVSVFLF